MCAQNVTIPLSLKDFAKMTRKQLVVECRLMAHEQLEYAKEQVEYEKTIVSLRKALAEAQPPESAFARMAQDIPIKPERFAEKASDDSSPPGSWNWAKKWMFRGEKARVEEWRVNGDFAIGIRHPEDVNRLLESRAEFTPQFLSKLRAVPFVPFIAIKYGSSKVWPANSCEESRTGWEIV